MSSNIKAYNEDIGPTMPLSVEYGDDCVVRDTVGRWWFWDETYDYHGPYETEHEAQIDLALYCHFCL